MREYKAITKTPMIPTRSNGMGKLMVEIIDINILDKAETIADYAKKFELILIKSSIK